MMQKLVRAFIRKLINRGFFDKLSDSSFIRLKYWSCFGKKIDLNNPQSFNEKLQWLKLHDRQEKYTVMVDKADCKKYVSDILGDEVLIPDFGLWNSIDEIDFDKLPGSFVLKCTHDSGGIVIVKNQKNFDRNAAKIKLEKSMKNDYFYKGREWPYKNVRHRILAEKFMGQNLQDYKIFCFNGKARMTLVCTDRYTESGLCEDFFDNEWKHLNLKRPGHRNYDGKIARPCSFDQMLRMAEKLSDGIPFARIDFYDIQGKVYFGEITLYPANGFVGFEPDSWDKKLGEWISLPDGK